MSGSEGVGEEADLGLFGKLMPGGFYLYYFSQIMLFTNVLFTFLQNEEPEAPRVMYLAQLGRVGLGSETLSPGHPYA